MDDKSCIDSVFCVLQCNSLVVLPDLICESCPILATFRFGFRFKFGLLFRLGFGLESSNRNCSFGLEVRMNLARCPKWNWGANVGLFGCCCWSHWHRCIEGDSFSLCTVSITRLSLSLSRLLFGASAFRLLRFAFAFAFFGSQTYTNAQAQALLPLFNYTAIPLAQSLLSSCYCCRCCSCVLIRIRIRIRSCARLKASYADEHSLQPARFSLARGGALLAPLRLSVCVIGN